MTFSLAIHCIATLYAYYDFHVCTYSPYLILARYLARATSGGSKILEGGFCLDTTIDYLSLVTDMRNYGSMPRRKIFEKQKICRVLAVKLFYITGNPYDHWWQKLPSSGGIFVYRRLTCIGA